jgi:hypothetical protein
MKHIALTFVFLLITISTFAQGKRTVVHGQFSGEIPKEVSLQIYRSIADRIDGEMLTLIASPGNDGSFGFTIYTDDPLSFGMLRDGQPMFRNKYLAPGDSAYFTFSKNNSLIEGTGRECLGFQFAFDKLYDNNDSATAYRNAYKTLSRIEFAQYMKQRREGHQHFFDEFFKEIKSPALFKRVFTATEDLDFAINMAQYSWRSPNGKGALLDTAFWAYLKRMNFNNPDYFLSYRYEHFLRELPYGVWHSLSSTYGSSYYSNGLHVRDSLAKHYFKGKAYDYALYHILNDRLKGTKEQVGKPEFDKYYKQTEAVFAIMSKRFNDKTLYKRLQKRLLELKK